jgi:predicted metal-dependent enzyme (double-stranded beta helix superfamily)
MAVPELQGLISYLEGLTSRMDLSVVSSMLETEEISMDVIRPVCRFSDTHYQRNKIASSDWFDLLLICWKPGQATSIHDHAGSSCGFKVLSGEATEVVFEKSSLQSGCNLVTPRRKKDYLSGEVCRAKDSDIHAIVNNTSDELVTLHIYSPPLSMNYYKMDPMFKGDRWLEDPVLGKTLAGARIVG